MIHTFSYCKEHIGDIGVVGDVKEALVTVTGLTEAVIGEGVTFENGLHGMIVSLRDQHADVLVFSRELVPRGTRVARTGKPLSVTVGEAILGRTVNAMGYLESGEYDKSSHTEQRAVDAPPPGIAERRKITRPLYTGVGIVDLVVPVGHGQRELVMGDRVTGKTYFLKQTMLAQAKQSTIVVYVAIGKRQSEIRQTEDFLRAHGVYEHCVIVAASSYDSPGEIYIAPYTGMTIAEYFRDAGKDVLVLMDDLTTHARYYREFALLLGSFPGRESYPGDIFHIHARLLERAGNFSNAKVKNQNVKVQFKRQNDKEKNDDQSVAITCMPVVDTVGGDMTGYIQTNIMSMTDGHVYFDTSRMAQGMRPAVNVFLSVTRVGRQTQSPLLRDTGKRVLSAMKAYEDAQRFLRFGPELTETVAKTIKRGAALSRLFHQTTFAPMPLPLLTVLVARIWSGKWDGNGTDAVMEQYSKDKKVRDSISKTISSCSTLEELAKRAETVDL